MVFVAFLVPLALYLLLMSCINRQPRPVIVPGTWDFLAVLFASSGFLLLGGPVIMTSLNEKWRMLWMLGEFGEVTKGLAENSRNYLLMAGGYFLLVLVIVAWTFLRRRGLTVIYNVDPNSPEECLQSICRDLHLEATKAGSSFLIGKKPDQITIEVEKSPVLRSVTLKWKEPFSLGRTEIENRLKQCLGQTDAPYHDIGPWLNLVGTAFLGVAGLILFGLILRMLYS